MNELLIELKERLNQIAITGLKSVSEDFRLKKLYDKLNIVSKKSSVLSKISELVLQLIESDKNNAYIIYPELVNLTNAVLYTQGISFSSEKEIDVEVLDNIGNIPPITYSQIDNIKNALDGKTSTVWNELKKSYEEKNLIDYRLLDDFLKKLGSSYVYEENFSIITILSAYGESIIPLLLKKYDTADSTEKCNIIKIISGLSKEKYNDYYIKWIEEEYKDAIIASAIEALKYDKNNEQYLLAMKIKKKKSQQARISALAYMGSKEAHEEIKNYCIEDAKLFESLFKEVQFLSEQEIIDLIRQCVEELRKEEKNILKKIDLFNALTDCAGCFNSKDIIDVLIEAIEIIENEKELKEKFFANNRPYLFAVNTLLSYNDEYSQKYLVSIKDRFNQNYIEASFIASVRICTKEEVFDNFSSLCVKKPVNRNPIINSIKCYFGESRLDNYNYCFFITNDLNNLKQAIQWDKRWFEFTVNNNLLELSTYFIPSERNKITDDKLKQFYLDYLEKQRSKNKTTYEVRRTISYAILGLYKIGAKQEAEENIKNFSSYGLVNFSYLLKDYFSFY